MDFSKEELNKIKNDEIFTKKVNSHLYWIKPVYEHKSYPIGSINSHKAYFHELKKYFGGHIPETNFIMLDKKVTLIVQQHIEGTRLKTLKQIKELLQLKQNKDFRDGLIRLLENKKWVIDFYRYEENFISTQDQKLFYVDGRMPIFPEPKEERYKISKKRTLQLIKQTE